MPVPLKNIRKYALELLLLIVVGAGVTVLACPTCLGLNLKSLQNLVYGSVLCIVLWKGNGLVGDYLDRFVTWFEAPLKRLVVTMVAIFLYSLLAILAVNYAYFVLYRGRGLDIFQEPELLRLIKFQIGITYLIALILHSREFFLSWRRLAVDAERLKRETITSQYETLKNQVNPHFLFNSLNTLTALVHPDPDLAVKFIKQLSDVYRYVLDSRDKEVVPLAEELKFVEAYLFLQRIRHGENLRVQIDLPAADHLLIAPLSLQMLLENAIKHNTILEEEPLHIRLHFDEQGEYIVVRNTLQERLGQPAAASTGMGLANIQARYRFLSDQGVEVLKTPAEFVVKLPVLSGGK
jgi:sensor histidine kinase YesM